MNTTVRIRRRPRAMFGWLAVVSIAASAAVFAQMPPAAGGGAQSVPGMPAVQGGMPDARMMSGIPMPMGDLPTGTVSVRLVRGDLANTIAGHDISLFVDGKAQTAKTDDTGRAQFSGVPSGTTAKASATVDGERLESEQFTMPPSGGVRLLLSASGAPGAAAAAPAKPGTVSFGADSRIAIEFDDANLSVFYLLAVVNNSATPVNPSTPVAFELPGDAAGAALLEGSSSQAQVKGRQVTIGGPFKPGRTTVELAYQVTPSGGSQVIAQSFPLALDAVTIMVQKPEGLQVQSPQLAQQREMSGQGKVFILGSGPALPGGRTLTLELTGLPHHDTWPRTLAIALAGIVLAAGLWSAIGGRPAADAVRTALESRRDRLFAELLRVEEARRAGTTDEAVAGDRRAQLMAELERIYGELDRGTPTAGGDKGIPA